MVVVAARPRVRGDHAAWYGRGVTSHDQCTVSGDGKWIAARSGDQLTLHLASGKEEARTTLTAGGRLLLVGDDVVDVAIAAGRTTITTLALPTLKLRSTIEIPGEAEVRAVSKDSVLLARGKDALILRVVAGTTGFAPMMGGAAPAWAAGLADDQFLAPGARGLEIWDGATRRIAQRVRFEVDRVPRHAGVATAGANLWLCDHRPQVTVVRISDGKVQRIGLTAPADAAVGHLRSSWLLVELAGAPHAINLVTGSVDALPCTPGAPRAVVPRGAAATVVEVAEAEVRLWEIGAPAPTPSSGPLRLSLEPR